MEGAQPHDPAVPVLPLQLLLPTLLGVVHRPVLLAVLQLAAVWRIVVRFVRFVLGFGGVLLVVLLDQLLLALLGHRQIHCVALLHESGGRGQPFGVCEVFGDQFAG